MAGKSKWMLTVPLVVSLLAISLTACSSQNDQVIPHENLAGKNDHMAGDIHEETAANQLPSFLKQADKSVSHVYQLASKHRELIEWMPCYCGCGQSVDHRSNRDCFIKEVKENGNIVWDSHAVGCYNCQQIALESIQLKEKGKSALEIRQFIDNKYKEGYAEPTPTPIPGK
ncbi:PCYCGC motif-containing (lipo)protein [Paenactinomyces guangxiensis]|uniref:Lipoprotein n=1 Tax=Paenactinomyces guangxiensis TaxID=1490290 RepID=A0A7W1WTL8_9BACL|nr:PCYCGC motif-containing (lipo)protein [Paenactinomyces guangxiensis]MBA4495764.1 hypothetical protein [Paenactinomyces guangxiensis]MBH8592753.1 hypothetical protein [Paenactinomyces guangxiensis]